jgi:hypothetical protein
MAIFVGTFPEGWESIEGCPYVTNAAATLAAAFTGCHLRIRDQIIDAAGDVRAAFFVRADHGRRKLAWRGELLRKARVYVCKPERWLLQRSFESIEECSC